MNFYDDLEAGIYAKIPGQSFIQESVDGAYANKVTEQIKGKSSLQSTGEIGNIQTNEKTEQKIYEQRNNGSVLSETSESHSSELLDTGDSKGSGNVLGSEKADGRAESETQSPTVSRSVVSRVFNPKDLPDTMDEAVTSTTLGVLKKNPHFEKAKYGASLDDAVALVNNFLSDDILNKIASVKPDIILTADKPSYDTSNVIPSALSFIIAQKLGIRPMTPFSVMNQDGKSKDKGFKGKFWSEDRRFIDTDLSGLNVVIVDDVYTTGETVLSTVDEVIRRGGNPVMVYSLAHGQAGKRIKSSSKHKNKMLKTLGLNRTQFEKKFGYDIDMISGTEMMRMTELNRSKNLKDYLEYIMWCSLPPDSKPV